MDEYLEDEEWGEEGGEFVPTDPFEGIGKRDQDIFFRVLDLVPDEERGPAIEYFMDHPAKILAIIAGVKKRRELIENQDIEALHSLFDQERITFQQMMGGSAETDDAYNAMTV